MSNHVTHRMTIKGPLDDVAAFKKMVVVKEDANLPPWDGAEAKGEPKWVDTFDFNQVIAQPKILDYTLDSAHKGPNGRIMLSDHLDPTIDSSMREATVEEQAEIDAAMESTKDDPFIEIFRDSSPPWYSWRLANWGTKWNAYHFSELNNEATYGMAFDTAWSTPTNIVDTLVEKFPTLQFEISWFDEGWCHAGDGVLKSETETSFIAQIFKEPNAVIYEKVYGCPPSTEEDWSDHPLPEEIIEIHRTSLRHLENFECLDVDRSSNSSGVYPLTAVYYSDDREYTDDELYAFHRDRDRIRQMAGLI